MTDFLSATAKRVESRVSEVLERGETRVLAEVPAASTGEREELRDHLHILLARVVVTLSPDAPGAPVYQLTTSERHGGERALLESYSLGEVLQEYSILRRTLLEVLEEDRPISLAERTIINDALEQALIGASIQYALIQRRADQKQVQQARAELVEIDEHRTRFLAWLTPLSTISHAHYILDRLQLEDELARRQIAVVGWQARHLSRLAEDLLAVSRISQGTLEVRAERLDLRQPLLDAGEACKPAPDESEHRLFCELPNDPVWVNGDPVRLVQVFTNLLNNAARYTPSGGEVRLSLEQAEAQAIVRVQDRGIGIDPSMLSHIFAPFVQVALASPKTRKGLSLELALVRQLVKLHGGTATAFSSGLGHGSEFVLCLPVLLC